MTLSTVRWGTRAELADVLTMAAAGELESRIERVGFAEVHRTLDRLRPNGVEGRAVLTP